MSPPKQSKKEKIKKGVKSLLSFNKSKKEKAETAAKVNSNSSSERQLTSANSNTSEVTTKTASSGQAIAAEINSEPSIISANPTVPKAISDQVKTILLIGSTGKGKSTLANVLTDTNDFQESDGSTSQTREIQSEEFVKEGINYQIIDTVGLGDTKLKKETVLDKIAEAVYLAKDGVGQVLFVINDKFNPHETANYDLLRTIIFDKDVVNHTTIIRTRFADFKDQAKCQADIKLMVVEESKLAEIINSCQKRVVYVDNPSLNLLPTDHEDDKGKKKREGKIANRKETRNDSRKILINHLQQINQNQTSLYQPPKLKELNTELKETFEQKKSLEKQLQALKDQQSPITSPILTQTNSLTTVVTATSATAEPELETKESSSPIIQGIGQLRGNYSRETTQQLENERARLEQTIATKQKLIREKVLQHILNNATSLTEQLGGEIFLTNVTEDGQD
jgi:GTP-binding protein EngB required for normal cell division